MLAGAGAGAGASGPHVSLTNPRRSVRGQLLAEDLMVEGLDTAQEQVAKHRQASAVANGSADNGAGKISIKR